MKNKFYRLFSYLFAISFIFSGQFAFAQKEQQTPSKCDNKMDWFGDAKLGIFIHWGIYAVKGISESWSFHNGYLPYQEYMDQLDGFTAKDYNPKLWVKLIEESGARYTVITSKHHDGVALWDTKANDLSIPNKTPAGRDVLTPFIREVKKSKQLKTGIYFSLIDWSYPDYPNFTKSKTRYKLQEDTVRWNKFRHFMFKQLGEISNQYNPDLIWFDGGWENSPENWNSKGILKLLRKRNKNIIVNSRIEGNLGDYGTPEIGVPITKPEDKYWELCLTMNDSWGYQPRDMHYKTSHELLRTFVDCFTMGGNLLLDIGPSADGTIPSEQVRILKDFGRWTKKHNKAIYNTIGGIPNLPFQGYNALSKDSTILYLYIPYKPIGEIELKGLVNKIQDTWVVGNGTHLDAQVFNKLSWNPKPGNVYISIPDKALDEDITVLALKLDGPIKLYGVEQKTHQK